MIPLLPGHGPGPVHDHIVRNIMQLTCAKNLCIKILLTERTNMQQGFEAFVNRFVPPIGHARTEVYETLRLPPFIPGQKILPESRSVLPIIEHPA